jgi:hypothetical protein
MNFASHVPWYRRFVFGDPWPNKTSWKVLEADVRGSWLIVERHTRDCTCSYCRNEHGRGVLWLPQDRKRGWRVINLFHWLYIRWIPGREPK